ncbi:fimbrial biogenesis chaperone [Ramlibacter humi]|uniref:Molecular chaperone n=1 Tax=Ramlibacter humi TaxID=2530451 RepID=A0A4Z0BN65_9BURK|nr:fimbria/pilus periplasmic chaperone [Ramlibacter humi]TFZ00271.1 molecular chaperone [Ramlibacter humi]
MRACWKAIALFSALVAVWPARSADLQLSPVSIQFTGAEKAQALWLMNTGTQPLHAQVRLFRWSQADDEDRLEPTQALAASPPMVEIAPGRTQMVRIVRREDAAAGDEQSFRLLVDEIPVRPAAAAGGDAPQAASGSGLQLVLRYSVPVFVNDVAVPRDAPAVGVAGAWAGGDTPTLTLANPARRRVRVSHVVHEDAQGRRTVLVPGLLGYVLSGQRRRWGMPASARSLAPGVIKARLQDTAQEYSLATISGAP